jgi:hypothetical protein
MVEQEVYMNIPVVEQMAKSFASFGNILQKVSKAMEAAIQIIRATAFIGLVGGAVLERFLSLIKPNVDKMAAKMVELDSDIRGAISNYQTGDTSGSNRFR